MENKTPSPQEPNMSNVKPFPNKAKIEQEASEWIVIFDGDIPPTQEQVAQLNDWIKRSPLHKEVLTRMAHTWHDMDVLSGLRVPVGQSDQPTSNWPEKARLWLLTPLIMLVTLLAWLKLALSQGWRLRVAVPALFVCVLVVQFFRIGDVTHIVPDNLYITAIGEQSTHVLADGSTLWLNSNSKAEVLYTDNKRMINLIDGEAHFDVQHDPNRPFEVYAGNRMVKAVGTAFSVYRLEDRVEVMVTEGKVDLSMVESTLVILPENSNKKPTVSLEQQDNVVSKASELLASLEAGQSVAIPVKASQREPVVTEHEPGELARKMSWLEGRLVFAGESLEEVVAEVSRHTPIVIEVNDPDLRKLRIGGQFHAGETEALFDVLETGFGVKINRITDNHVLLQVKKR